MTKNEKLECMGTGMAYGYYLYLKDFPLKKLQKRISGFEDNYSIEEVEKKILILVPKYCRIQIFEDDNLKYINDLKSIREDVAGVRKREYTVSVYKVNEKYFTIEIAQCLDALNNMEKAGKLDPTSKNFISNQFFTHLAALLNADRSVQNKYILLSYSDDQKLEDVISQNENVPFIPQLEIPFETRNIGSGLAYWFYYNYLVIILPHLKKEVNAWEKQQKVNLVPILFIIIPDSCNTDARFSELPNCGKLEYATDLNALIITAGATQKRPYNKNVIKLWNDKKPNEKRYCLMEYATPVRQLYRMFTECHGTTHWTEVTMREERFHFTSVLNDLLRTDRTYQNLCKTICLSDDSTFIFSELILKKINQNEEKKVLRSMARLQIRMESK